jgi:alkylhydroperoxidase family enzyme
MPAIPYRTAFDTAAEPVVEAIRARRGGRLLNLDLMLLYSPPIAQGWGALMGPIRNAERISPRHRELAICAVAFINGADYESHQHARLLVAAGGSDAQVAALADAATAAIDVVLFDTAERAVLALALDSTCDVAIRPDTLAAVRAAFPTPEEVLELMMIVASYNMVSRLLIGLGVEIEGQEA